jgi:hypothetical protein
VKLRARRPPPQSATLGLNKTAAPGCAGSCRHPHKASEPCSRRSTGLHRIPICWPAEPPSEDDVRQALAYAAALVQDELHLIRD